MAKTGGEFEAVRIFFTGVGGQGTLLATQLVGEAALEEGLPVTMSEIHGMAQRGGVVESSAVMGNAVSPTIADGEADILLAFEPLEAARALPKCHPKTVVITGTTPILPFTVATGQSKYPELAALFDLIRPKVASLVRVEAEEIARLAGAERSSNVVMIGVLAGTRLLPISDASWRKAMEKVLPSRILEVNLRAFQAGTEIGNRMAENR